MITQSTSAMGLELMSLLMVLGVGVGTAIVPPLLMVPMFQLGVSPMPAPPSLFFAESLLGMNLPMPVGLVFHPAYVVFWSLVFTGLVTKHNLATALGLGTQ